MKRTCVWAALFVAMTCVGAGTLSAADARKLALESALRKAEGDIREAMETVTFKGTPRQKTALRDSQRNWSGKGHAAAINDIQVGNLSDLQKNTLVTQARALKLKAFAQQVEAGAKPITLNGKARRISDEFGSGWGICSQVSVPNATRSSCMTVAHTADLAENAPLKDTLDSAAAEGLEIAVTGILASPEGFDPATVNVAALQPETPPASEQAQTTSGAPQAQQQQQQQQATP